MSTLFGPDHRPAPVTMKPVDDRPQLGYDCLRCGKNPRPKRTNWDEIEHANYVMKLRGVEPVPVTTHHHHCFDCHAEMREIEERDEEATSFAGPGACSGAHGLWVGGANAPDRNS